MSFESGLGSVVNILQIYYKSKATTKIKSQRTWKCHVYAIDNLSVRDEKLLKVWLELCIFAGLMLTLGKVKAYSRTKRKCGDHLAGDSVATEAFLSHFWKSSKKKGASWFDQNSI